MMTIESFRDREVVEFIIFPSYITLVDINVIIQYLCLLDCISVPWLSCLTLCLVINVDYNDLFIH